MPEPKKNFNVSMPAALVKEYERMCGFVGDREKWLVGAAAILALAEHSDDEIKQRIARIAGAESVGLTADLVRGARPSKRS